MADVSAGARRDRSPRLVLLVAIILLAGIVLRIAAATRGYNFDVDSYRIVAGIMARGGNVYAETARYNYGPVWFNILHLLDLIQPFGGEHPLDLRMKVAGFLTLVDIGLFLFLLRRYGLAIAALFFLNPVSILITGYHSQFDNLAVFVGLLSVAAYDRNKGARGFWICLLGLGLSLSIKHLLFIFPAWLAMKEANWRRKLLAVAVPYAIFLGAFLPYQAEGRWGIIGNVFFYKSFANAPFWSLTVPAAFYAAIPMIILFCGSLLLIGFYTQRRSPLESLHIYLIALVTFSSAIANQYLAIPIPSISVNWNWAYAAYSVVSTAYLAVEKNGLHLAVVRDLIGWQGGNGFRLLVALLAVGLLIQLAGQDRLSRLVRAAGRAVGDLGGRITAQLKSPW